VANRPSFDHRIARASELVAAYPASAQVLNFYIAIARYQKALYGFIQQAQKSSGHRPSAIDYRPFADSLDTALLLPRFAGFLNVVKDNAPRPLASIAEQRVADSAGCETLLRNFWQRSESENLPDADAFFARAFLQPYAEFVAERTPAPAQTGNTATCPICESEPVVGVLREENLGAKRSFICSLCSYEWDFLRAMCPGCGEDRSDALATFVAEEFHHVRVEACDTCKVYMKTVDLTRNGLAIPVVDELATLPLTLWAEEHGYTKLQPNLMAV